MAVGISLLLHLMRLVQLRSFYAEHHHWSWVQCDVGAAVQRSALRGCLRFDIHCGIRLRSIVASRPRHSLRTAVRHWW